MRAFLYFSLILISLCTFQNPAFTQLSITNFSNKNDVYSIFTDNDTVWIGTSGGVLKRHIDGTLLETYTVDDGLGANFVSSVAVDQDGNKWFATFDNGVTKFDGTNWTVYNEESGWIDNKVYSIDVDLSGNIWFGSFEGATKFDGTDWTQYVAANGYITYDVKSVSTDGDAIWFGTPDGLYRFFNENWTHYTTTDGLASDDINVVKAKNNNIWIGTNGEGVSLYNYTSGIWTTYTTADNLPSNIVFSIDLDINDEPIIATESGIANHSTGTWIPEPAYTSNTKVIKYDKNYRKWVGFGKMGGGIDSYDISIPIKYEIMGELAKNDINDIKSDQNNVLYVATQGGGLSVYEGGSWTTYDDQNNMPSNFVYDIAVESDGSIWTATTNGVAKKSNDTWTYYSTSDGLISDLVTSVDIDQDGLKWFGTGNGASSFDGISTWNSYTTTEGLLSNIINAITVDHNNHIWFLHNIGLSEYTGSGWNTYTLSDMGLSGYELVDIDADTQGGIWVASVGGVAWFDGSNWTLFNTSNSELINDEVISVYVDPQNVKHFGTKIKGVSIYNGTHWGHITRKDGLASEYVSAVYFDGNYIWSGGRMGGLSRTYIPPLSITAFVSPESVCSGNSATLQVEVSGGFGNYIYSWTSEPEGFTSSNQTELVNPNITTTYFVQVYDDFESGNAETELTVTQFDPSNITGPIEVCVSDTEQPYSVLPDGTRTFVWSVNGGYISHGQNTEQIHIVWDQQTDAGYVNLTETDANSDCAVSQTLNVNVHPPVVANIVAKGENLLICTDSGMVHYQWYKNDIHIEGAGNQFYSIPPGVNRGGSYHVELQSEYFCRGKSDYIIIGSQMLKLYPNPANGILTLEFTNKETGSGLIEIKDFGGKTIMSKPYNKTVISEKLDIQVSLLLPGIYNIDIYLNNKILYSEKIIKN